MSKVIIRLPKVKQKTGSSRSSIYKGMNEGTFPRSVSLGDRAIGWIEDEVDGWIQQRIDQRDELHK
jgi:prophage regulatory protein